MITKWFIGVKSKSKGYFKHIRGCKKNKNGLYEPRVNFTKQTALAKSFNTKEEALDFIDNLKTIHESKIERDTNILGEIQAIINNWHNMSFDNKVECLKNNSIRIRDNNRWFNIFNFRTNSLKKLCEFADTEILAINNWNGSNELLDCTNSITQAKIIIDYINNELIVRECEIEYKFMTREKRKFKWEERKETDTCYTYCVRCGGAIPNVPQLVIGSGYRKETIRICAICMCRLAEEAKIQSKNIPEDILEHYNTQRFIDGLG